METSTHSTLTAFIDDLIQKNPTQVISTFRDEINVFTIEELNEKANLLAKGFLYQNISKGTPVALVLAGTTNCLTFVLALAKVGAILIPLNKEMEIKFIEQILNEEQVHSIGFYADVFLKTFTEMAPKVALCERGYLNSDRFPSLKNVITLGSIKNRGIFTTRELMLIGSHMDDLEMEDSIINIKPNDIFVKKVSFNKKGEKIVEIKTHEEILFDNFSFPALQNFLLNTF